MTLPPQPKIYHIAHVDRLPSIIADGFLWCDEVIVQSSRPGTTIGMSDIKRRRFGLRLTSHNDLKVGQCVPFYFCPRSIMLYLIHQANHQELSYRGGQGPIVHLETDLNQTVAWAIANNKRWAFTSSNAASHYFEDYSSLDQLTEIDWDAVQTNYWSQCKEGKQAEFLIEHSFPWGLGVHSGTTYQQVVNSLSVTGHRPQVEVMRNWYY